MSRRHAAEKREIIPDPKFGNVVVSKFMNAVMYDGKKSVAEGIVYGALEMIERLATGTQRRDKLDARLGLDPAAQETARDG